MFSGSAEDIRVLIAHPGGPIFARKNNGHWGIPKGEIDDGEEIFEAAIREFEEETGMKPESDDYVSLGTITQKGGKVVHAWAFKQDWGDRELRSNVIDLEWPHGSGKVWTFPEIDEVQMADYDTAKLKMKAEQFAFVERLIEHLKAQQKLDPTSA